MDKYEQENKVNTKQRAQVRSDRLKQCLEELLKQEFIEGKWSHMNRILHLCQQYIHRWWDLLFESLLRHPRLWAQDLRQPNNG